MYYHSALEVVKIHRNVTIFSPHDMFFSVLIGKGKQVIIKRAIMMILEIIAYSNYKLWNPKLVSAPPFASSLSVGAFVLQPSSLNTPLTALNLKVGTLPCQNLKNTRPSLHPNLVIFVRVPFLSLWPQQWCHLHWWWLPYNTNQKTDSWEVLSSNQPQRPSCQEYRKTQCFHYFSFCFHLEYFYFPPPFCGIYFFYYFFFMFF